MNSSRRERDELHLVYQPQVEIDIDREKAAALGVTMQQISTDIGSMLGGGYVNLTAEYRDRDATNRAGPDLRPNYVPANGVPGFDAQQRARPQARAIKELKERRFLVRHPRDPRPLELSRTCGTRAIA